MTDDIKWTPWQNLPCDQSLDAIFALCPDGWVESAGTLSTAITDLGPLDVDDEPRPGSSPSPAALARRTWSPSPSRASRSGASSSPASAS